MAAKKSPKKRSEFDIMCPKCGESTNKYGVYYPPDKIYCTNCNETITLNHIQVRTVRSRAHTK